jgi:hypothetical protein
VVSASAASPECPQTACALPSVFCILTFCTYGTLLTRKGLLGEEWLAGEMQTKYVALFDEPLLRTCTRRFSWPKYPSLPMDLRRTVPKTAVLGGTFDFGGALTLSHRDRCTALRTHSPDHWDHCAGRNVWNAAVGLCAGVVERGAVGHRRLCAHRRVDR